MTTASAVRQGTTPVALNDVIAEIERDLRGSLGAVTGFAQVLEATGLDNDQELAVREIRRAGDHLLEDLEMLFEYWRARAKHRLEAHPFELTGAAMATADLVAPEAAARQISLASPREVEPGCWVLADEALLISALARGAHLMLGAMADGGRLEIRLDGSVDADGLRVSLDVDGLLPGETALNTVAQVLLDHHVTAAGGRFSAERDDARGHIAIDLPRASLV